MKLPALKGGELLGKVASFYMCPLTPLFRAGFVGHVPINWNDGRLE